MRATGVWSIALVPCLDGVTASAEERPNIILILADDMGYSDVGAHGCEDIPTPQIDRIAKDGVRFTDAYANGSFCTPTRAALTSCRYQQRTGNDDLPQVTGPLPRSVDIRATLVFVSLLFLTCSTSQSAEPAPPWSARPDVVAKFESRRGQFNYNESEVPKFTLPDPLIGSDGSMITTLDQWNGVRRNELLELFRGQVYGRRPDTEYSVQFKQNTLLEGAFDGAATGRSMTATVTIADRSFSFPFVVFVPVNSKQAVPAVVHINNRYFIPLEKAATEHDPFWPAKTLIERGYATASFHTSDVDPDRKDGYADGIRSFFATGQPPADDAWRSLSAWGWAASRVLDHLDSLESVDGTRVAVVGHSRGGKTSLWAACEDTRFAIAYSNNSGCGGAALSRRAYGETVGRITSSFPHWFCKPFSDYADREDDLPVDQHDVMALIAPRGVYVASADEDLWADPRGEYASLIASAPVFRLLGRTSITNASMPALNQPRVIGQTGYHIRTGGHGLGDSDWNWFLDFADRLLKTSETGK